MRSKQCEEDDSFIYFLKVLLDISDVQEYELYDSYGESSDHSYQPSFEDISEFIEHFNNREWDNRQMMLTQREGPTTQLKVTFIGAFQMIKREGATPLFLSI